MSVLRLRAGPQCKGASWCLHLNRDPSLKSHDEVGGGRGGRFGQRAWWQPLQATVMARRLGLQCTDSEGLLLHLQMSQTDPSRSPAGIAPRGQGSDGFLLAQPQILPGSPQECCPPPGGGPARPAPGITTAPLSGGHRHLLTSQQCKQGRRESCHS